MCFLGVFVYVHIYFLNLVLLPQTWVIPGTHLGQAEYKRKPDAFGVCRCS